MSPACARASWSRSRRWSRPSRPSRSAWLTRRPPARRLREEARRSEHDIEFQAAFATAIGELFPGCPPERAGEIAGHAGARRSGRVGRSAAGRALDPEAVTLAVVASVRHVDTPYDRLLMASASRADARRQVVNEVSAVIDSWRLAGVR